MSPTFDPKKNAANLRKHGVPLSDGDGVLNDPLALTVEDDAADSERRFVSIGLNSFGSLMVVVFSSPRRRRSVHLGAKCHPKRAARL